MGVAYGPIHKNSGKKIMRFQICPIPMERALKSQAKNRRSRLTVLSLIGSCGTLKNPHHYSKRVGVVNSGGVVVLGRDGTSHGT